jgi:Domain of unknown function (DUF4160)
MPSVSRFLGIVIYFYYRDHNPPHFHALYGEFEAEIIIEDLLVDVGYLPPRVLGLVMEWASLHKAELLENWEIGRAGGTFKQIAPLI